MKKIYRITCEYEVLAETLHEAQIKVAEECGLDFFESHIIVEKTGEPKYRTYVCKKCKHKFAVGKGKVITKCIYCGELI